MNECMLSEDGSVLTLASDGIKHRFHAIWLRDNAWDEDTRSPTNGQKLIALRDIPRTTHISKANIREDSITLTFSPEEKIISYNIQWLKNHSYDQNLKRESGCLPHITQTWDRGLMSNVPTADFKTISDNPAQLKMWLADIVKYGFAKLINGPIKEEALFDVVDLFGFVRETNYGRLFNVRTEVNATNLAFTGLGLQAHTDNPYRDPVPTIQVLYCLESSAAGGENMVVDGYKVAQRLKEENEEWFDILCSYAVQFEYSGEKGVCLRSRKPMIELSPDGELIGVRFNNRSAAAFTDIPFEKMATFYDAYRRMGEIIDDPAMEVTFRLNPGECFIVDNTRVLHARKAYSGTGTRWLQGCYADKDGLNSTFAAFQQSPKENNK